MEKNIVIKPHISEKATFLSESGFYVFRVDPKANKREIKEVIKKKYGVDVLSVCVVRIPSKRKRMGRVEGIKQGYKKAVIKIKSGQNIDITLS